MKSMEEKVEKVRRRNTIFYDIFGLQYRKTYIGIIFTQIYTFSVTWRESYTGMHVSHSCNIWLQQQAIILIEDNNYIYIYIYIYKQILDRYSRYLKKPFQWFWYNWHITRVLFSIANNMFLNHVSFCLLQHKNDMNEKTQYMVGNIEKVRRKKKTILYAVVGLLSRNISILIKFPQIYILCDTWIENDTSMHGSRIFNTWLHQGAFTSSENRE
jgi:hypothetical protein